MIRVTCKCGCSGSVPPKYAGKQIKCRQCASMIAVPVQQSLASGNAAKVNNLPILPGSDDGDGGPRSSASPAVGANVPVETRAPSGKRCAIVLTRLELLEDLPPVCIRCGAPATATCLLRFNRMEVRARGRGLGTLISVIRQALQSRDLGKHRLQAPCCGRHKHLWGWNFWGALATLSVMALIVGWFGALKNLASSNRDFFAIFLLGIVALFVVIVLIELTVNRLIAQFEVDADFLFLRNVHSGFREALDRFRQQRGSEAEVPLSNAKLDSLQRWKVIKRRFWLFLIPTLCAVYLAIWVGVRGGPGKLTDVAWLSAPHEFGQTRGSSDVTERTERFGDPPQPLPNDVLAAWKGAGAQVGCIEVNGYAHVDFSEKPFTKSNSERPGLVFIVPAFRFVSWRGDQLARLPAPSAPFGLSLHSPEMPGRGLKTLAGMQHLQALEIVSEEMTDAELAELPALPSLQVLDLYAKKVTDAGLKKLAGLKNLRALKLFVNPTDEGLKELGSQPNLRYLTVGGKNVTDAGLKELARLKSLRTLLLLNTQVTDAGENELRTALPGCNVIR